MTDDEVWFQLHALLRTEIVSEVRGMFNRLAADRDYWRAEVLGRALEKEEA